VNGIASARLHFIAPFFTNRDLTAPILGNGGGGRLHGVAASKELMKREKSGQLPTVAPPLPSVPPHPRAGALAAGRRACEAPGAGRAPEASLLAAAPPNF